MTVENRVIKLGMLVFLSTLILVSLFVAGCGGTETQGVSTTTTTATTKQYAANGISFDYPNTWGPGNSSNPNAIAALVSPTGPFLVVLKEALPSGYTLKTFNDQTVMGMNPMQMISGQYPTVAGVPACESVFKTNDAQVRTDILEKDGNAYVIICSAPMAIFDNAQTSFNMVINSFKLQ
jgi:hypothetical protein